MVWYVGKILCGTASAVVCIGVLETKKGENKAELERIDVEEETL